MSGARHSSYLIALVVVAITSACTSSGGDASPDTTPPSTADPTTTTAPPVLLGLAPDLALGVNQCWADIPEATTTTTTTAPPATGTTTEAEPTTTEITVPETLPEPVSTIASPPIMGIVDCAGTHEGEVYATFCLVPDQEATAGEELTAGPCSNDGAALEWPGDRQVRRTAARICLQRFSEAFGEPYELSERVAEEFTPTEGVWDRGDHRVVCSVEPLPPTTETDTAGSTETES